MEKPMRAVARLGILLALPFCVSAQSLEEGNALVSKGKLAEAKTTFESVLKQNDKNAEAHYRLGLILISRRFLNEDDAVDHMEQAVELNHGNADYQYGLGAAYGVKAQNAGVIKQAFLAPKVRGAFEKAATLNPKLTEAHIGLAQYYWRAPGIMGGDMDKAYKEADIAIQLDEMKGRQLKASILIDEKKIAEAVQEMKTLTQHRTDDWRAWRMSGLFFWRNQMTDDAITSFGKYVALRPDTADSHQFLALAYFQKKDANKAIANAKKALELDGENINATNVLAQAYELSGQKKEALEKYQRLLVLDISPEYRKTAEKKIKELQ
jgi:tetratricopeptide (TPR) repeat protein